MGLLARASITISGKTITNVMSLRVYQSVYTFHTFEAICRFDALEGEEGKYPLKSQEYLGAKCEIKIDQIIVLKGLVTELEGIINAHTNEKQIAIRGKSPEIVADNVEDCRSFENMSIKSIVSEVLSPFSNDINLVNSPLEGANKHPYIVQYNETPYRFISRLCSKYGEWFFYNGLEFRVGKLRDTTVELKYKIDLQTFNARCNIRPVKFHMDGYDYVDGKPVDKISSDNDNSEKKLSDFGQKVYAKSAEVFNSGNSLYYNQPVADKAGKDHIKNRVALKKSGMVNSLVTYTGSSENPNLKVGDLTSISNVEYMNLDNKYRITEVQHYCELTGQYQNYFTAIDAGIDRPPFTSPVQVPFCETQVARVMDNDDKDDNKGKMNRVRVQFHWQKRHNQKTPWLRIAFPHGGDYNDEGIAQGLCFIPEIGDEVLVGFEGNNAEKPYVIGSFYHGKAKPNKKFYSPKNNSKVIRTRSGHTIEFYDEKGKEEIRIYDKDSKNTITLLSHEKTMKIWSEKEIFIEAQKIHINAKDELNLNGDNKVTETTNSEMIHKSGQKIHIEGNNIDVKGDSKIQLKGGKIKMN